MKALIKAKPEEGIWIADIARPAIGPNDVLIKVKTTAICGTDVHIYNWDEWSRKTVPVPMITGHEYAGIIEKVGEDIGRDQARRREARRR